MLFKAATQFSIPEFRTAIVVKFEKTVRNVITPSREYLAVNCWVCKFNTPKENNYSSREVLRRDAIESMIIHKPSNNRLRATSKPSTQGALNGHSDQMRILVDFGGSLLA